MGHLPRLIRERGVPLKIWRYLSVLLFGLLFSMSSFGGAAVSANEKIVYHVPIEETVEKGLSAFLERALTTAEAADADLVVFEVNTPGGAVDAAGKLQSYWRIHQ